MTALAQKANEEWRKSMNVRTETDRIGKPFTYVKPTVVKAQEK